MSDARDLTRQELCVRLHVSESTVRRLEAQGMPYTQPEWARRKSYNLVAVGRWMRASGIDKTTEFAPAPHDGTGKES